MGMGMSRCRAGLAWGMLLAICGLALVLAVTSRDAGASKRRGPYTPPSLQLTVDHKLQVGKRATVRASGGATPGLAVWVFVDPGGEPCAPAPSSQPSRAIAIASGAPVSGAFVVGGTYKPRHVGRNTFCAYLGPSADPPTTHTATAERKVRGRFLRAAVARRTVVIALRRHGFAERTIDALEERCRRLGPAEIACRFSARFPGYKLTGRGRVRLADEISYRFRVRAQGVDFLLTDKNEERASGERR